MGFSIENFGPVGVPEPPDSSGEPASSEEFKAGPDTFVSAPPTIISSPSAKLLPDSSVFFAGVEIALAPGLRSDYGWEGICVNANNEHEVTVMKKDIVTDDGRTTVAYRGLLTPPAWLTVDLLYKTLWDKKATPGQLPYLDTNHYIKNTPTEQIYYQHLNIPSPGSDRHSILRMSVVEKSSTRLVIHWENLPLADYVTVFSDGGQAIISQYGRVNIDNDAVEIEMNQGYWEFDAGLGTLEQGYAVITSGCPQWFATILTTSDLPKALNTYVELAKTKAGIAP